MHCGCWSEKKLLALGMTATPQPTASATARKFSMPPCDLILEPARRTGLTAFSRNSAAARTAASSEAELLFGVSRSQLTGPGCAQRAVARLQGISIYAGFLLRRAARMAVSMSAEA